MLANVSAMVIKSLTKYRRLSQPLLFSLVFLDLIYPFPAWGSPYQTADHFWPLLNISSEGVLEDVKGAAHTIVYNGGRIKKVDQLGTALYFDGRDDWVDTGNFRQCSELREMKYGCGFNADCVTDPTRCKDGFTLVFWLKVYGSGFIMSSGSFTNSKRGPGFRLVYDTSIKGFEFILETATKRWRIHVQGEVNQWMHMVFSWKESVGIEYYEDGNLSTYNDKYFSMAARPLSHQRYTPVITLARPNKVFEVRKFGHFEIAQLGIWMKWLSNLEVAEIYSNGVVYNENTAVCCYFKSVGLCTTNECYKPKYCKRIDATHKCLCPRISMQRKTCQEKITSYCADQVASCKLYANQPKYCKHRKMREVCPRSCQYCAAESTTRKPEKELPLESSANIQGISPGKPSSSSTYTGNGNGGVGGSGLFISTELSYHDTTPAWSVSATPTMHSRSSSYVPIVMPTSTMPSYGNITIRKMPRGKNCETLSCQFYAHCRMHQDYAQCECKQTCSLKYAPVCGTNSKTYMNKCVLRAESCISGRWIRVAKKGYCGSRYPNAAHYWPFNSTSSSKTLLDVRGKCKTQTYNGVRTTYAEQLGPVLSLDGIDDHIIISGIRSRCISDPTLCSKGLTVAFWLKYHGGEFILSGGRYTVHQTGPGFRFICLNCASSSNNSQQPTKRFVLDLSTQTQEWKITLDFLPKAWLHLAFTWHLDRGLKFYKNGKIIAKDKTARMVKFPALSHDYEIITLGRPNSITKLHNYGKFDIGHLVIWQYELSAYEVEVAFLTVLAKTTKSLICCHFKKGDPCILNPCSNGVSCRNIDEKYACICPDITERPCAENTGIYPCVDRTDDCAMFASQDGYCQYHKKYMMSMCAKSCSFCRDVNGERSTALPPLQTSAPESSLVKTNIPLSTPRLSEEANRINSRKSQTTDHAPSPSKGKSSHRGIIRIFGSRSKSMSTIDQEGSESPSQEPRKSTKYDPKTVASNVEAGLKSSLHTNSDGRKSKQPSESSSVLLLHSRNEKSFWPNEKKRQTDKTLVAGESTATTITNLKPDGRIKTTRMTLFPSPSVKSKGFMPSAIVSVGGNKPPISSPFTGSVAVTQRNVIHPEASPSYIGTHEIRTVGIGSQTVLIQPGVSKTQSQRILKVSPTPTPFPTVPRPHVCDIGQSQPCICMNCEGNSNKGLPCCIDVIDTVKLNEGVVLSISSMALKDFISGVPRLTNVVSKLVADHCSQTSCIQGVHTIRKRNIIRDDKKQTNGAEEPKQFITSWDGSPISPSDAVRTPRNSPTKSLLTATPATVTPSITRSRNVKVVMFKIAPNPANQKLSAAFYVTVTSLVGGKNMTYVLKADVLAGLIRRKRDVFKRELNMKIDSVTTWPKWSKPEADSATSSGLTPSVGAALTPEPGAPNVEGQEGRNSTTNMSRGTFIIVLVTGIGGFVVLAVIIIYMLVKFLRRMKGEFVPDKVYPNEQKANGGSDQLIPSFVDPSTPRITDVPKKTVRAGGGGGSGSGGGQGSGGSKKIKKPMGVKVTYKPPKWD